MKQRHIQNVLMVSAAFFAISAPIGGALLVHGLTDAPCQNQHGSLLACQLNELRARRRQWNHCPPTASPHQSFKIESRLPISVMGIGISLKPSGSPSQQRQNIFAVCSHLRSVAATASFCVDGFSHLPGIHNNGANAPALSYVSLCKREGHVATRARRDS